MASSSGSGEAATERRGIPGAQFVEDVRTYLAPKPASTPTPPSPSSKSGNSRIAPLLTCRSCSRSKWNAVTRLIDLDWL
ncbi:hypothetical protein NL676_019661 [Syzygium grande]|nr:hypothetical protein NL676_019661 [Syzygium grande]